MSNQCTQAQALTKMRSGKNIFLTGLPGTGKSYIIRQFIEEQENLGKQVLVCAPTGIAALNIGGVTMHQAFSIPIPAYGHYMAELTNSKVKAALAADIIIIDEISMCRNDMFEFFGYVMDYVKIQKGQMPQIIVVGDMFQLPPVVPDAEITKLKRYGFDGSGYCFTSRYWAKLKFTVVVLHKVIRQQNEEFINNLGLLRVGDKKSIEYFNKRVLHYDNTDNKHVIQICSTNAAAQDINDRCLNEIETPMCLYKMKKEKFCPKEMTAEESLVLKEGARVMFIANDVISKQYTNGEFGTVTLCLNNSVRVLKDSGEEITVLPHKWSVYDVKTTGNAITKNEVGSYVQIPLKLAYCVTMHKTQGQTYDSAIITPSSFTSGQLYVALSRVTSIDGLYLTQPIEEKDVQVNKMVFDFYENFSYVVPADLVERRKRLDKAAADKKKRGKKKKSASTKSVPKSTKTTKTKKTTSKKTTATKKKTTTKKKTGATKRKTSKTPAKKGV